METPKEKPLQELILVYRTSETINLASRFILSSENPEAKIGYSMNESNATLKAYKNEDGVATTIIIPLNSFISLEYTCPESNKR